MQFVVRSFDRERDLEWVAAKLAEDWPGRSDDALTSDGLIAEEDGEPVGLLFWRTEGEGTEVTLLWAFERHQGIGTALLYEFAVTHSGRIRLVTTDDNTEALAFAQRMGFAVREVTAHEVEWVLSR
jgi:GNAT superfamily N-acetyltransferase